MKASKAAATWVDYHKAQSQMGSMVMCIRVLAATRNCLWHRFFMIIGNLWIMRPLSGSTDYRIEDERSQFTVPHNIGGLQKFLSAAGLCSRRKGEVLIAAGRVRVNGQTVTPHSLS